MEKKTKRNKYRPKNGSNSKTKLNGEKTDELFVEYINELTYENRKLIETFFYEFNIHCLLAESEKKMLRMDFERAILYYASKGIEIAEALELLNVENLGGFYARPPILWFPLDDAAKIYPLSMKRDRMAVFRLSVYLKETVVPELLQMALNFIIKRFPSFATTLKKGIFWHYLDTTKRHFCVVEENDIPCQPLKVSHSGSQSFRIIYYKNRISAEFFHVLTDGTGGMTFLKVLTAEYLRLTGVKFERKDDIWNINDTPRSVEFENAFANVPKTQNASGFVDKPALQMSGRLSRCSPCRIVHIKMNAGELKATAKRYEATVTAYLLALMFIAHKAATDELNGDVSIQVPVNMRKFYPSETVRNFAMYCGIRLDISEISDIQSIIENISQQMIEKTSKESMGDMLTATQNLVGMVRYVPLVIKQPVASVVYGFLGDNIFSNTLSNVGVINMPHEFSDKIESMDFVLGPGITNRASCALVTFNDIATLSITKMTEDPSFEEKMYSLIEKDGISVVAEGSGIYAN